MRKEEKTIINKKSKGSYIQNEQILLSVIIPVHNAAKYIKKTSLSILRQSLKCIELILVENFSTDNSLRLCYEIAEFDERVVVAQSFLKGTSMARKKGVELARGKYIVFSDQDDSYIDSDALKNMVDTIISSNAEICQFGYFKSYQFGLKRELKSVSNSISISIEALRKNYIKGIFEGGSFSSNVWSKIYLAQVLKDAVKHINIPLYFSEDMFLNICCLTSEQVKTIRICPDSYYVWKVGIGFSSSKSAEKQLMKDYEKCKPIISEIFKSFKSSDDVFLSMHRESLGFMKYYLFHIYDNEKAIFASELKRVNNYNYIKSAKDYLNKLSLSREIDEELLFLASDFDENEFLNRFLQEIGDSNIVTKRIRIYYNTIMKIIFRHN